MRAQQIGRNAVGQRFHRAHLVPHAAERAVARRAGGLAAPVAGVQLNLVGLDGKDAIRLGLQEAQIELQLGAGPLLFHRVEQLLVLESRGADGVRALVIDVFDAAHYRVGGHFAFVDAAEGLGLLGQAWARGGQHRRLPHQKKKY